MEWWLSMQLKSGNPQARRQAVEKLSRALNLKIVEAVLPLLRDRDLDVRKAAATALGKMKDDRAGAFLVAVLQNPSAGVRLEAAAAQKASPELEAALKHKEYWVRESAAKALARIRGRLR